MNTQGYTYLLIVQLFGASWERTPEGMIFFTSIIYFGSIFLHGEYGNICP